MEVTFIEEDGSGKSNATSYVSVDGMKQYWYDIGYDYGSATDNDIKRLLNKSTAYIDNNYRRGFPGRRQYDEQKLEWPRYGAYYLNEFEIPEDSVPPEVKNAVNELAFLIYSGNDPSAIISKSGRIISESSKVDVISESTKYEEGSSLYTDIYPSVDDALSRITGGVNDRFTLQIVRTGGDSP